MSRKENSSRIDLGEFARVRGTLSGHCEPARLERLSELLAGDEGRIEWTLSGDRRSRPGGGSDGYLTLRLTGSVQVECIRCLKPVDAALDEERVFRLTATESQAQRIDAEHDEFDALVEDTDFDILELVEDEAILALPIAPRHPDCALPAEIEVPADEPESRPNPFAVLQALKGSEKDRQ